MSRCHNPGFVACLTLLMASVTGNDVSAYEVETHQKISEVATVRSVVDGRLKESLAVANSLDEEIQGKSLLKWIQDGSLHADDWTYYFNHFHNPLAASWSQAGYSLFPPGQSAILWGQNPSQGYPSWAWQNARQYFLHALTSTEKADRDLGLANTFQGLGHLVHLIQDMASPAHTRNDPHLPWNYNYETLVKEVQLDKDVTVAQTFLDWINRPVAGPDPAWQTLQPNDEAPIPIARLIDTDRYNGANPEATIESLMGLAEYTNANYFSEDRIFTENDTFDLSRFAYPRRSSVTKADYPITLSDGTNVTRQYFRKDFHGESGYRLATVGFLGDYIQRYQLDPGRYRNSPALDEAVYRDYAERLLPRAVSYSAALLDYFFRGKLEARVAPDPMDPQVLLLTGKNASAEALKDGTLKVYGADPSGGRNELGLWTISGSVAPGGDLPAQPLSFRPPTDRPVPERYMVVYQGSLGEEKKDNPSGFVGAVIGKAAKYVGVIEQLFINEADGDVYFRNGTLVTPLNVRSRVRSGSFFALRSWGTRNDTFLVEGADPSDDVSSFYIFTLNRPRPDQVFRDPPTATLVRGPEPLHFPWALGILPFNYLAALDDNLDVILPGYYVEYIGDFFDPDATEIHGVLLNNTTRTVLFDLKASAMGAPAPGPRAQSGVIPRMILRLDAANRGLTRIVVSGYQLDSEQSWGYFGVVDGNGNEVARLVNWEPFQLEAGNLLGSPQRGGKHLLWEKFDYRTSNYPDIYVSNVDDGTSTQIGTGLAEWDLVARASLLPVAPDYLLRTATPTYFVKGWTTDGTVVLPRVATPGFPPEDPDLVSLNRLADPPPAVLIPTETFCGFGYCSAWQVIEDPDMLR